MQQVGHTNTNQAITLRSGSHGRLSSPGQAITLRNQAIILHMRTVISSGQWQPWTAVSSLLGLISRS